MQSKLVGALVVLNLLLLSLGAGWFLTRRSADEAREAAPGPAPSGAGLTNDVLLRLDEIDRRLGNMERRLGAAETVASEARGLAEALRDERRGAAAPAAGPGAAPAGSNAGTPPEGPAPAPGEKSPDEVVRDRFRQVQDFHRTHARTWVPVVLSEMASTDAKVQEKRRTDARLEARQFAIALALTPEQADQLGKLWVEQADRAARDVGPLVKDGLAKADLDVVRARLDESWAEMDRQAREALGDGPYAKLEELTNVQRTRIREALADLKPK